MPDFKSVLDSLDIDRTGWGVEPPATFTPGADAALANLQEFVAKRLKVYDKSRNDPNVEALSRLSPWVNHGQVRKLFFNVLNYYIHENKVV